MYIYIYTCIHIYIYIFVYICMIICIYMLHISTCISCLHMYIYYVYTHICIHRRQTIKDIHRARLPNNGCVYTCFNQIRRSFGRMQGFFFFDRICVVVLMKREALLMKYTSLLSNMGSFYNHDRAFSCSFDQI